MYLSAVTVKVPPRTHVGYIVGVGDRGPMHSSSSTCASKRIDLAAIVGTTRHASRPLLAGPRAYETSDALVKANPRLLDYATCGGTPAVQYGAQDMSNIRSRQNSTMRTRPAACVTMENAPVRVIKPDAFADVSAKQDRRRRLKDCAGARDGPYLPRSIRATRDTRHERSGTNLKISALCPEAKVCKGQSYVRSRWHYSGSAKRSARCGAHSHEFNNAAPTAVPPKM
jgi:hypothetical protein